MVNRAIRPEAQAADLHHLPGWVSRLGEQVTGRAPIPRGAALLFVDDGKELRSVELQVQAAADHVHVEIRRGAVVGVEHARGVPGLADEAIVLLTKAKIQILRTER